MKQRVPEIDFYMSLHRTSHEQYKRPTHKLNFAAYYSGRDPKCVINQIIQENFILVSFHSVTNITSHNISESHKFTIMTCNY